MFQDLARAGLAIATTPMAALAEVRAGSITGRKAVLSVVVRADEDLLQRQERLQCLRAAAADPRVVGLVLRVEAGPGGWAAAQDLRDVLVELASAGTSTTAVLENPGNAALWIASVCDRVVITPMGQVVAFGVGAELAFAGAALRRLGLEPDLEAAGAYKSAGETFTRTFASAENRQAVRAIVDDLHDTLVSGIAEARGLDRSEVAAALERAPLGAEEAVAAGLADVVAYPDEVRTMLQADHGDDVRIVPFDTWAWWTTLARRLARVGRGGKSVAVLHLQGPIVLDGTGPATTIRARHVVPILDSLTEDDDVVGVVLHVNSPGGSAYASDLIWRGVDRLRRKKPVVAAFEDVAASGGFYLSAPASHIVVRAGTLTGSIGVFGGKVVASGALRSLGVHTEAVTATPNATLLSPYAPFTDAQRARFREGLQRVYDGFVERVAAGRGRMVAEVEPHCRGRVWTGRAAVEVGLVDAVGTLDDAVAHVWEATGTPRWLRRRVDLPGWPTPTWIQRRVRKSLERALPSGVSALVAPALATLGPVAQLMATTPMEALALWPFDLRVR